MWKPHFRTDLIGIKAALGDNWRKIFPWRVQSKIVEKLLHQKGAFADWDEKEPQNQGFHKKLLKRIFLENVFFLLIPSNFDVSRRGISVQFNVVPLKKCPRTKKWVEPENRATFWKKAEIPLKKKWPRKTSFPGDFSVFLRSSERYFRTLLRSLKTVRY